MKIGIVGFGFVGKSLGRFMDRQHSVYVYDKFQPHLSSVSHKEAVNGCDVVFVAVPTPASRDGWTSALDAIEDVFAWLTAPACIKSTVPPGTTQQLADRACTPICFSPEYIGESMGHSWCEVDSCGFLIVGGHVLACNLAITAYSTVNDGLIIHRTSATTAELCKYMENCFLATKVAFANQFFDIASSLGVEYQELVHLWTLDPRIGSSHCSVTEERGFGGRCLPKDIRALISAVGDMCDTELLRAVVTYNDSVRMKASTKTPL